MRSDFEQKLTALRDKQVIHEPIAPKPAVEAMSSKITPLLGQAGEVLSGEVHQTVIEDGDKVVLVFTWDDLNSVRNQISLSVRETSIAFIGDPSHFRRLTGEETEDEEGLKGALLDVLSHPVHLPKHTPTPAQ